MTKTYFLKLCITTLPYVLIAGYSDASEYKSLRGFEIGQPCQTAIMVAEEAKKKEGMRFHRTDKEGNSACEPFPDGSGVRGIGMSAFRPGFKDLVLVSMNRNGRVSYINSTTLWFQDAKVAPPNEGELKRQLTEKFGHPCTFTTTVLEKLGDPQGSKRHFLGYTWLPGLIHGQSRCETGKIFDDEETWHQNFLASSGLRVSAKIIRWEELGRLHRIELNVIVWDAAEDIDRPKARIPL